ncbi:MAG: hypothetical protein KatS3mg119_1640 [Rhodothalassiaceae bacterium]|nr:MAG: hypothetical protein KatS3mg119_1640 [Rhodothalassiaceae bacterium]
MPASCAPFVTSASALPFSDGYRRRSARLAAGVALVALLAGGAAAAEETAAASAEQPQTAADQSQTSAQSGGRLLEEIVVTAQKREQNVQSVGIAIDAFSGEQLEDFGIQSSMDVATISPGVHVAGSHAGQQLQFSIRGVVNNDFNPVVETPNAVYLDEAYIAALPGQNFGLFDIERVEILKGPQGTLFGRNATGGLVHYISRQPTFDRWEGYADGEFGLFDSPADAYGGRITAALGGPLSDTVATRAAIYWKRHGGYLKNLYPLGAVGGAPGPGAGADMGDDDTLGSRLILTFEPSDRLQIRLTGNFTRSRLASSPYQAKPTIAVFDEVGGGLEIVNVLDVGPNETRASIGPGGIDLGTDLDNDALFGSQDAPGSEFFGRFAPGGDFFGYRDPDGPGWLTSADFAFKDHNFTRSWGWNGRVKYDINQEITLTWIGDFKSYDELIFLDVDAAPVNQSANYAAIDATSVSQELRLNGRHGPLTWVAGFYYLNIDNNSDDGLKFPINSVVPGSPFDLNSEANLETNSYSGFVHVQYDVNERLSLILGVRLIEEKKDYFFEQAIYGTQSSFEIKTGPKFAVIGPVFGPGGPEPFTAKTSDTLWAGVARVEYHVTPDVMLWASAKRGVKAGSFNAQLAGGLGVPASAIPYRPEVLYAYETGLKSTILDGMGRFNANFFYYDYDDYQAFLFTGVSGVVVNNDATYKGLEGDLTLSPVDGLDIRLSGAWIDAKVKDVPLRVGGPIVRDVRPTYTPKFQANVMVGYAWPAFGGLMRIVGEGSYSSSFFYNLRNFDADKFGSYFLLNTRLAWTSPAERWEVAFNIRNLTQEKAGVLGFDLATLCGCNEVSYRAPRWFGLQVKYSYN